MLKYKMLTMVSLRLCESEKNNYVLIYEYGHKKYMSFVFEFSGNKILCQELAVDHQKSHLP